MASYTRQSTFSDGDLITAELFNDEYNQLLAAFENTTGHKHDGTVGEGPVISIIGDAGLATPLNKILIDTTNDHIEFWVDVSGTSTQQFYIADGAIVPVTDNDIDLGTSSLQFKDLYINGTANIDSLVADTADINGGTIDGVTIGASSAGAITGTTITATSFVIGSANITETELEILDGATLTTTELNYVDGVTSSIQTQINTKAPLASPSLTGIPTAPTAASNTNTTQVATTAYVQTEITDLIDAAPGTLDTLNELAAAINDDANYNTTLTTALATKLPLAGGTMTGDVTYSDNVKAQFGTSQDLQIYHDGSNSYIKDAGIGNLQIQATGSTFIKSSDGTKISAQFAPDSYTRLYYNNAIKLQTTSTGIDVTGVITTDGLTTSADINFGDSDKAIFGAASDLQIYHDGSNSYIKDTGTGTLRIQGSSSILMQKLDGEIMMIAREDGAVELNHNGSQKIKTTSSGIDVTGTVKASTSLMVGSTDAPARDLEIKTTNPHIRLTDTDSSGGYTEIFGGSGITTINADKGQAVAGSALKLSVDATDGLTIDSNHNVDIPNGNLDVTGRVTADGLTSEGTLGNWVISNGGNVQNFTRAGANYIRANNASGLLRFETGGENLRQKIASNGDISFYDDTGSSQSFFWDSSAESLGIGTTSPSAKLHVKLGGIGDDSISLVESQGSATYGVYIKSTYAEEMGRVGALSQADGGLDGASIAFKAYGRDIVFNTNEGSNNAERARILSSGAFLIGKTALGVNNTGLQFNGGLLAVTKDGGEPLILNRKTTDGIIVDFRKDNTTVGTIGTSATDLFIGTGVAGLRFREAGSQLMPWNTTTNAANDSAIDIGKSDAKFKDIYLSGTANFGSLSDGTITITGFVDEDNMATNSATLVPTQQSVKAYVDSQISSAGGNGISFEDNEKAQFGASNDLQIYHDGNNSRVEDTGTGGLRLIGGNFVSLQSTSGENMVVANENGAVTLYHDASAKLATTSTGIDVTGIATMDGLTVGTTSDAYSQVLINSSTTGESELRMGDTDTDAGSIAYTNSNDTMTFRAAAGARMSLNSSGIDVTGTVTADGATITGTLELDSNNLDHTALSPQYNMIESDITGNNTQFLQVGGDLRIRTIDDSKANPVERLRIDHASGDISFYDDTGSTQGLFWDASAESLGIGTSSPDGNLEVVGTTVISGVSDTVNAVLMGLSGTNRTTIQLDTADTTHTNRQWGLTNIAGDFYIGRHGLSVMTMKNDGKVGIGTASPDTLLHLSANTGATLRLESTDTAVAANEVMGAIEWEGNDATTGSSGIAGKIDVITEDATPEYSMRFFTQDNLSGTYELAERMKIKSDGRVGIGTSSPSGRLEVKSSGSNTDEITLVHSGNTAKIASLGQESSHGSLILRNNGGANRVRLSAGGNNSYLLNSNFGIGITSPSALLHIQSEDSTTDDAVNMMILTALSTGTTTTGFGPAILLQGERNNGVMQNVGRIRSIAEVNSGTNISSGLTFETSTAGVLNERVRISYDGKVGIGTTSPSVPLHVYHATDNKLLTLESGDSTSTFELKDNQGTALVQSFNGVLNLVSNNTGAGSNQIRFSNGATEIARFNGSNLGIGTTSPDYALDIRDDVNIQLKLSSTTTTNNARMTYAINNVQKWNHGVQASDSSFTFYDVVTPSTPVKIEQGAANNTLVVDSNSRVGIGTNNPQNTLQVNAPANDGIKISSTTPYLFLNDTDSGAGYDGSISQSGTTTNIGGASAAQTLVFRNKASFGESARLDTSGNLLVGTTNTFPPSDTGNEGVAVKPDNIAISRNASTPLFLDRMTSDGVLIDLRKDNNTGGIIGINEPEDNAEELYIANGTGTSSVGLAFWDYINTSRIAPCNGTGAYQDNSIDLGFSSARFDDIYATNGTIQTSDRNDKQDIQALTAAETRVATACKGLLRRFRWQDAVTEKGDEARYHFGIISQDLQSAFTAEGLDAGDYGMFISQTWEDSEGVEQTRLGVRYSELLAFIIAAI